MINAVDAIHTAGLIFYCTAFLISLIFWKRKAKILPEIVATEGSGLSLNCSETGCIYNQLGQCVLHRAMPAGGSHDTCVYFVQRQG